MVRIAYSIPIILSPHFTFLLPGEHIPAILPGRFHEYLRDCFGYRSPCSMSVALRTIKKYFYLCSMYFQIFCTYVFYIAIVVKWWRMWRAKYEILNKANTPKPAGNLRLKKLCMCGPPHHPISFPPIFLCGFPIDVYISKQHII